MQKILITFTAILFLFSNCAIDSKSREDHKHTYIVCGNIYAEVFCVFGQGAYGGSLDAEWLTDSVNFRIFLGSFDEIDGGFNYECKGDTLCVTPQPDSITGNPRNSPVTKCYSISELKKKQNLNVSDDSYLTLIIILFVLTSIALRLYVGNLYRELIQSGILLSDKKVSLKILKTNLQKVTTASDRQAISKCLNVYKIFLFLCYSALALMLIKFSYFYPVR